MPFSISYRKPGKELKIRAHVAPTKAVADAVVAYVKAEYGEEPESVTPMGVIRIDPGGGARLNPQRCIHTAPSGTIYQMDHYHVQEVLAQLREAPPWTYGDSPKVYRTGCHYISLVLASDAEDLMDWLSGLPEWTLEGASTVESLSARSL